MFLWLTFLSVLMSSNWAICKIYKITHNLEQDKVLDSWTAPTWHSTFTIREVKDFLVIQESSMAINMLVMRVNQAQKVKETVNNLLLRIVPCGHRVIRGDTKEDMQQVMGI